MKMLTVIIHTNIQQQLSELLRTLQPVNDFTFTQVEGHGLEIETDSFVSAHDDAVEDVLSALRAKEAELKGRSFYGVSGADKGGQL